MLAARVVGGWLGKMRRLAGEPQVGLITLEQEGLSCLGLVWLLAAGLLVKLLSDCGSDEGPGEM